MFKYVPFFNISESDLRETRACMMSFNVGQEMEKSKCTMHIKV